MKRFKVIVVGKAFITTLTTTPEGSHVVDVDNATLVHIDSWHLEIEAESEEAAAIEAAAIATQRAYDYYGGGPLWACLPVAAMELPSDS